MTNLEKTTTKNPSIWLALIYQRKKNNSITNLVAIQNLQPSLWMLSHFSHVRLFVMLWTVAHQAPLSMGFSRQEYWSGLPCPPPGDLPDSGMEPLSPVTPALQVDSLPLSHLGSPTWSYRNICTNTQGYENKVVFFCVVHNNTKWHLHLSINRELISYIISIHTIN